MKQFRSLVLGNVIETNKYRYCYPSMLVYELGSHSTLDLGRDLVTDYIEQEYSVSKIHNTVISCNDNVMLSHLDGKKAYLVTSLIVNNRLSKVYSEELAYNFTKLENSLNGKEIDVSAKEDCWPEIISREGKSLFLGPIPEVSHTLTLKDPGYRFYRTKCENGYKIQLVHLVTMINTRYRYNCEFKKCVIIGYDSLLFSKCGFCNKLFAFFDYNEALRAEEFLYNESAPGIRYHDWATIYTRDLDTRLTQGKIPVARVLMDANGGEDLELFLYEEDLIRASMLRYENGVHWKTTCAMCENFDAFLKCWDKNIEIDAAFVDI